MTLQQLNYVIVISEAGSLNKAAERLYVSQPSLTSAVKELEKEVGIVIFNRTGRGVTLTAEGAAFLPYARQVYGQYLNLMDAYGSQGARRQQFAVSTQHYSFAVKAFVEMTRSFDVAMEKLLAAGSLTFTHLIDCKAYVYLWRNHPLAGKKAINLEDLAPYPCISFEQGDDSNFYLAEEILPANEYPREIKCCDRATVLNLMVGLNGYTLCSGIICEELNGSDYIAVPYEADAENPNSVLEIGYVTRKNSILSHMGECYIAEIKKYLAACNVS